MSVSPPYLFTPFLIPLLVQVSFPGADTHHCPAPGIFLQGLVNPQPLAEPGHARFGRPTLKCPFTPISALLGPLVHQATANEAELDSKGSSDPGWLETSAKRDCQSLALHPGPAG